MKGKKLIIVGIALLLYWTIASYVHDITLESLVALDSDSNADVSFDYPLWWPLTVIRNYAGMAGFILLVTGAVKAYMSWRLNKK